MGWTWQVEYWEWNEELHCGKMIHFWGGESFLAALIQMRKCKRMLGEESCVQLSWR